MITLPYSAPGLSSRGAVLYSGRMSRYVHGRHQNRFGSRLDPPDPSAVDRALGGDRSLILSKADRDAAIDAADRNGASVREIAERLGMCNKTVARRRAARKGQQ